MIAINLISHDVPTVSKEDTGEDVMSKMTSVFIKQLPVLKGLEYLGIISEDEILNHPEKEPIGFYNINFVRPFCFTTEHIFEVMERMARFKLSILPVLDEEEQFVGVLTLEDVFRYFLSHYSILERGALIVIETSKSNYSLSEIARIVESEGSTIISSHLSQVEDSSEILVTIKVGTQDIGRIIATFQRFDYTVRASFNQDGFFEVLKDRYDSLMNFLNV